MSKCIICNRPASPHCPFLCNDCLKNYVSKLCKVLGVLYNAEVYEVDAFSGECKDIEIHSIRELIMLISKLGNLVSIYYLDRKSTDICLNSINGCVVVNMFRLFNNGNEIKKVIKGVNFLSKLLKVE